MKKLTALILCVLLVCSAAAGLADAAFTVTSQSTYVYPEKDTGAYFARVENTGDTGAYFGDGKLELFNEKNEKLTSVDDISSNPYGVWLEPGEAAYVSEYLWGSTLLHARVSDAQLSVAEGAYGYTYKKLPLEAVIDMPEDQAYENFINVTFANTTDETIFGGAIVCAVMDEQDNVIFVSTNYYDTIGVHPGSTITARLYVDYDLVLYFQTNNIKPARAEAILYYDGQI